MPDELSEMRKKEAARSCELAGFHYITADIGDLQSYYQSREHKDIMVDIFRQVNPDLIFIQKPTDYMCDHVAASKLAFDASFMATCPHYETKYPAIDKIAPIYYMGTASEVGFNPTEYVDITDVYETKIKMLMCHESQEVWLREHDNVDYTNECRILSEFRGMQCKVKYAEAMSKHDPVEWVRVMKTVYGRSHHPARQTKAQRISDTERSFAEDARRYLYTELSLILGIPVSEMEGYIKRHVESMA
jgi:LmbE family N-acetylglucosaminyl deacetylase